MTKENEAITLKIVGREERKEEEKREQIKTTIMTLTKDCIAICVSFHRVCQTSRPSLYFLKMQIIW